MVQREEWLILILAPEPQCNMPAKGGARLADETLVPAPTAYSRFVD